MIFQIHSYDFPNSYLCFLCPKYTLIFKCEKNGIKFEIVSSLQGTKWRNNLSGVYWIASRRSQ